MRLGKFIQSPTENKRYTVDYSSWLQPGETVVSVTFAVDLTTSPVLTAGTSTILNAGTALQFFVAGGVLDKTYVVTIRATTSIGQIKEDAVYFFVENPNVE